MARITDFSDLFAYAHATLPGCPSTLFNQHVQQGGRKFCMDSRAWREDLTAYDLTADEKEYTLSPITSAATYVARIEGILQVRWNTEDGVTAGNKGQLINWRYYSFNPDTNLLTFTYAPSTTVTSGLDVKVILVPHLAATDLNDWILNVYAETIIAQAVHTLKKIPKQAWTDLNGAEDSRIEYRAGIGKAKADIARNFREGSTGATS